MEKKRNNLLLVSTVFGAVFVAAVIVLLVWLIREGVIQGMWTRIWNPSEFATNRALLLNLNIDDMTGEEANIFNRDILELGRYAILGFLVLILGTVAAPVSFICNLIAWNKGSNRHALIGGISSVFCLNFISAPLCIVEYIGVKREIKNKLLFYTMIYTLIFNGVLIAWHPVMYNFEGIVIYFLSTAIAGLVLNVIAWKTDIKEVRIIVGIVYIMGIFTVPSAVMCFISSRGVKPRVKNELLFYTMIGTLILNGALIAGVLATNAFGAVTFNIYLLSATIAGLILNYIAWKTDIKEVRIIAGFVYILGIFTVPSAVMCFISSRGVKPMVKNELLFYTMTGTLIFNGVLIAILLVTNVFEAFTFNIYVLSATMVGLILNYIAWKTDFKEVRIIAGIVYILGIFTVPSAVMCFISCKGVKSKFNIKNKLLFYTMVCTSILNGALIAGVLATNGFGAFTFNIYFLSATIVGLILNYIAWKTDNKKVKIIAGIAYVLGISTVISAVMCFISCKGSRKLPDAEGKSANGVI
ncbi:MAG: hypothetical protein LBH43_05795 [Treponema sp.]|jgi:hypothetical protein|nr:hypothetical protein [Treponema sp.]